MVKRKSKEIKIIIALITILFAAFLAYPAARLLVKSFVNDSGLTLSIYKEVFAGKGFLKALLNSFKVAGASGIVTTFIAFCMAYTVHYTNSPAIVKRLIKIIAALPMLLPTLTYGFAIIYSFGKQGLLTRLFGRQLFNIYGFNGLLIGYVIYTLPVAFMLINNTLGYVDKKFTVVSRLMGDSAFKNFMMTVIRPLLGTFATAFIQCFFLCFTDFGIPASVGGKYEVIASVLYRQMLGSVPDFGKGSVVAIIMLVPSVVSIIILTYLERYNIRYNRVSSVELKKSYVRDTVCSILSVLFCVCVVSIFAVIFVIPFVQDWPYKTSFSIVHFKTALLNEGLSEVYKNSIIVAILTAVIGTAMAYAAALVTARSNAAAKSKKVIDYIAMVTNTIPGMVLGLAFLFTFSGTFLQGTFAIIIICNIIHYFSTPYLMIKGSLEKMNASWLLIQGLVSEYGEDGAKDVLKGIYENAGDHIEESGSGPLKLVRAGEAAVGFGLRQQAVADKESGLPIDYIDPKEGNFTLTESAAVVDKGDKTNSKAMEMAKCIIEKGRAKLLESYPIPLYDGETVADSEKSGNPKKFSEPLTVDLLKKHQALSEECKPQ